MKAAAALPLPRSNTRTVYTVQPLADRPGCWEITVKDPRERAFALVYFTSKAQAVSWARDYAKRRWKVGRRLAQLRIKGLNGRIQVEHTYGQNPRRTPG